MFLYIMYNITFYLIVREKYSSIFPVVQKFVDINLLSFTILINVMLTYTCLIRVMNPRVNHLVELTIPFTQLLKKDVHFKWGREC